MNKRLLGAAAAAVLAVLGTIAVLAYVSDADDRARQEIALVEVYVMEESVPEGADESELRRAIGIAEVQAGTVVDGVITDLAQLDGKVAAVALLPGEQVLLSRLIDEASYNAGDTRLTAVPTDKHEITISLEPQRILGGQVVPGDTVGIVATFGPASIGGINLDEITSQEELAARVELLEDAPDVQGVEATHFLLNQVLVTRVQVEELPGERLDANGNPIDSGLLIPTGNLLITLALDTHDVERFVYTAEWGRMWFTLEPRDSSGHDGSSVVSRGSVYDHPHGGPGLFEGGVILPATDDGDEDEETDAEGEDGE